MPSGSENLPRCYAPPDRWEEGRILLAKDETHHLTNVLRAASGDRVRVFDGGGREAATVLLSTAADSGCAELEIERLTAKPAPPFKIELVQAVPRKGRMETVLQKATELGVAAIQPVLTEHTVVRLDGTRRLKKEQRWRKIVIGAAKQCGTATLPELKPICGFKEYIAGRPRSAPLLICSLQKDARPLRAVLDGFVAADTDGLSVLTGPEGDFDREEYELAGQAGAVPASLGDLVLRTDTASIYMLSVLNYVFASSGSHPNRTNGNTSL